ncbi:MAG: hypothetical protein Q8O76_00725, partial [Chloroflexota bacterium]|nr:hypothetical protein [Chloroflexota bacterium]
GRTVELKIFKAHYGRRIVSFMAESVEQTDDPRGVPYDDLLGVGYSNDTPEDRAKREEEWTALGMGEKNGGYANVSTPNK